MSEIVQKNKKIDIIALLVAILLAILALRSLYSVIIDKDISAYLPLILFTLAGTISASAIIQKN